MAMKLLFPTVIIIIIKAMDVEMLQLWEELPTTDDI